MNWEQLKHRIYYTDGSLRDIYVQNTTKKDWQIWAEFVNKHYKTSVYSYETGEKSEVPIELTKVFDYWDGKNEFLVNAGISIGDALLVMHFFTEDEMESDIDPKEFTSIENHDKLIEYMSNCSKILGKRVVLTPENSPEIVCISIDKDEIKINLG